MTHQVTVWKSKPLRMSLAALLWLAASESLAAEGRLQHADPQNVRGSTSTGKAHGGLTIKGRGSQYAATSKDSTRQVEIDAIYIAPRTTEYGSSDPIDASSPAAN